jgi:hypothetical protein
MYEECQLLRCGAIIWVSTEEKQKIKVDVWVGHIEMVESVRDFTLV